MNLAAELAAALPPERLALVQQAAMLAQAQHSLSWLVGGPVRDLILGRSITDLDLVFEGPAPAIAAAFASATGGVLTTHTAFGTATVTLPGPFSLDFVTARSETYPAPAVLPVVTPSNLEADLRRRDFTINTLACSLTVPTWGQVVDYCGGLADLKQGVIRVLHDRSFVDDPTRILRAARFAARLSYAIEPHTMQLMAAATPYLLQTSSARSLHELRLLVREPGPELALAWLHMVGALRSLAITWQPEPGSQQFQRARQTLSAAERDLVQLGLLAPHSAAWPRAYPWTAAERRVFEQALEGQALLPQLLVSDLPDSLLDQLLQPFTPAALWLLALAHSPFDPSLIERITHYLVDLRPIKTLLTGDDLRRLGVPPGPRYRQILAELRAAQLAGVISQPAAAEAWVRDQR